MDKINGKVVWITGASSGIGEALAYHLSKKQCKLIISSRKIDDLKKVKDNCENNDIVQVLQIDLANLDEIRTYVTRAMSFYGHIDILINNAGISQRSLIAETQIEVYKKLIDINYLGTIALTKDLLPHFVKRKSGKFVTVTSLMGKFGSPYRSGYCGAKHALHGFFDVLRMEHEKDSIQVTLICPGFIRTNVAKNALTGDGSPQLKEDKATENGLTAETLVKKMVKAIERKKFEAYIGKKEIIGVYLKRFFPKILHNVVLKSSVR
ncbi:SDR family oxidoreductase [Costertonia aggregata]|uniref:SDR family oxidoreductase n=1 Tax=Costertonia aggregata TaxID=343403 RepID=A0A7H9AVV4_9FLAO|nr:SDR family oxidoreductase [Costertonia aggregata]QLG47155.1 SDR family oxidoreductase [Costertonia aggregata]